MCAIPVMPLLVNIFVGRVNFMRNLCVTTGLQMVCNKSLLTALAVIAPCKDVSPPAKNLRVWIWGSPEIAEACGGWWAHAGREEARVNSEGEHLSWSTAKPKMDRSVQSRYFLTMGLDGPLCSGQFRDPC